MKKLVNKKNGPVMWSIFAAVFVSALMPFSHSYAASKSLKITGEGSLLEHFDIPNPAVFGRIEMWAEIDVRWKITTLMGEPIVFCDAKWKPTTINVYGRSVDGKTENVLLFSKFGLSDGYSIADRKDRIDEAFNKVEMIDLEVEILSDEKTSFYGVNSMSSDRGKFSCNVGVLAPAGDKYSWNIPVSPDWDEFLYNGSLYGPNFKFLTPDKAKAQMKRADGQHFKRTYTGWRSVALAPSKYENVYVGSWDYVKVDFDFFSLRQLYYEEKAAYRAKQDEVAAQERLNRARETQQNKKQSSEKREEQATKGKGPAIDMAGNLKYLEELRQLKKETGQRKEQVRKVHEAKRAELEKRQQKRKESTCKEVAEDAKKAKRDCVSETCRHIGRTLTMHPSWWSKNEKGTSAYNREVRENTERHRRYKSCKKRAESTCSNEGQAEVETCYDQFEEIPAHEVRSQRSREKQDLLKSFGINGQKNKDQPRPKAVGKTERNDLRGMLGNFGNNDGIKAGNKQPAQPKANTSSMQSILDRYNK